MSVVFSKKLLLLSLLGLTACGTVPVEEQSEELRLLLGEIRAREQVLDKRQALLEQRGRLLANLELQQETAATDALPLAEPDAGKTAKLSFLPAPSAEAGQCYRLARLAPRLSAEPQTVVVQDAADQIVVEPPIFRSEQLEITVDYEPLTAATPMPEMVSRERVIELRPAYKSWQPVPASFDLRSEPLLASPAHQDFVPCGGQEVADIEFSSHWCAVRKAAEYRQQERKTVKQLSSVKAVWEPAETVTIEVREPRDTSQKSSLRAVKRVFERQQPTSPASYRREVLLPEFKTVTIRQLTRPASLSWRQVVCADNVNPSLLEKVQLALNERGYEVGDADGAWGEKTAQAVAQFRKDKMLPDIGTDLSVELLRQLEIQAP
jgi:hypothetical protein